MSIECGVCERDLRGEHDEDCPYHSSNVIRKLKAELAAEREKVSNASLREQLAAEQAKVANLASLQEKRVNEIWKLRPQVDRLDGENDDLRHQLAAQRAKWALAVEALGKARQSICEILTCVSDHQIEGALVIGGVALTDIDRYTHVAQSADALSKMKRDIFEEWCDLVCQEHPWIDRKRMQDAIRTKFGVTE